MLEKMAAPSDRPRQKSLPEHDDSENGALWEDARGLQQHVVNFLTNKAGDDLKTHMNIGDVLESLKEENDVLSEQVKLLIRNVKSLTMVLSSSFLLLMLSLLLAAAGLSPYNRDIVLYYIILYSTRFNMCCL